jgi:uncharacterized Tic20 family protein
MSDQEPQDQMNQEPEPNEAPPAPPQSPPTGGGELTSDERTWGMLAHLSALVFGLFGLSFLGPLIVMLTKGKEFRYVEYHAKEALNFQITVTIATFVCIPLVFVIIGILLLPVISIGYLVLTIIAAVKANEGVMYKYPFCLRLVK